MKEQENKIYESPTLTVVPIKTEQGYAISAATLMKTETPYWFEYGSDDPHVTQYGEDDAWENYTWNK